MKGGSELGGLKYVRQHKYYSVNTWNDPMQISKQYKISVMFKQPNRLLVKKIDMI